MKGLVEIFPTFVYVVFGAVICSILVITILHTVVENKTIVKSHTDWLDEKQTAHMTLNCISEDSSLIATEDLDKMDFNQVSSCLGRHGFGVKVKNFENNKEWKFSDLVTERKVYDKYILLHYPDNTNHMGGFYFYLEEIKEPEVTGPGADKE